MDFRIFEFNINLRIFGKKEEEEPCLRLKLTRQITVQR